MLSCLTKVKRPLKVWVRCFLWRWGSGSGAELGSYSTIVLAKVPTTSAARGGGETPLFLRNDCSAGEAFSLSVLLCRRHTGRNPLRIPCGSPQDPPSVCSNSRGIPMGSAGDPQGIFLVWHRHYYHNESSCDIINNPYSSIFKIFLKQHSAAGQI